MFVYVLSWNEHNKQNAITLCSGNSLVYDQTEAQRTFGIQDELTKLLLMVMNRTHVLQPKKKHHTIILTIDKTIINFKIRR